MYNYKRGVVIFISQCDAQRHLMDADFFANEEWTKQSMIVSQRNNVVNDSAVKNGVSSYWFSPDNSCQLETRKMILVCQIGHFQENSSF